MYNKKSVFVAFEGIEGSGKTFHSKILYKKIKKLRLPAIYTREPGGSKSAEKIRKIILSGERKKFSATTDVLLYLAARNEHFDQTLKPALLKKKIIICDRFVDSTKAYQVYGKGVDKSLVNFIHKKTIGNFKPDITFILKVNISKAFKRLNKRNKINRYDKFPRKFYRKVQNAFMKIGKANRNRYVILDNSQDNKRNEVIIFNKFIKLLKR